MSKIVVLALAVGVVTGTAGASLADDKPGPDWMPKDQVTQRLSATGYSNITGLKADDGYWEGKAVYNGKIVKFHADPKTGSVVSEKPEDED